MLGARNIKEVDASVDHVFDKVGFSFKDSAEPLMSLQALLALPRDEQIIKVRGVPPIRAKKIPYWEIDGLRDLIGENPLEGPAPVGKTQARLKINKNGARIVYPKPPRLPASKHRARRFHVPFFRPVSLIGLFAWLGIFATLELSPQIANTAMLLSYTYQGSPSAPRYTSCTYIALSGDRFTTWGGRCPFIRLGWTV